MKNARIPGSLYGLNQGMYCGWGWCTRWAVFSAAALGFSLGVSRAVQQANGVTDAQYVALGEQLQATVHGQTVWVKYRSDADNTIGYASGVLLDATHVLTAGHVIAEDGQTWTPLQVGTGPNAFTHPGQTASVASWVVHPSWNSSWAAGSLDAAVLTLGPGSGLQQPSALHAGAITLDLIYSGSGFGRVRTASLNDLPFDGNIRGFTAGATRFGSPFGTFSNEYFKLGWDLEPGTTPGGGWHGDSGGGVYDLNGYLVGLFVAYSGSYSSYVLRWESISSWVQDVLTPVAPRILTLARSGEDVQLVWQGKGGVSYVVQAGNALGGPDDFSDVSGIISLPGSGPVTTTFVDTGALTSSPRRFYRVRGL